jgi:L-threonylcarbamoyladenylate synthase
VKHLGRPQIITVDPGAPAEVALRAAAHVLTGGGVAAFPTETFYGLAARALDAGAIRKIFALKGRPESKPLLVLVDSVAMAETVCHLTDRARALMARYWPGALTLVLAARHFVPGALTAGTGTLGLRISPHPVALGLVRTLGAPVTAPSANPSELTPPTTADGVLSYFSDGLDLILDGGPTAGGAPSTVLDATVDPPKILRQGAVLVAGPSTT